MNFFRYFPAVDYDLLTGNTPVTSVLTQITAHAIIAEKIKQHVSVLYDYVIESTERPDTVATKLYGSAEYTWVVLVLNNILSLYDWPLSYREFDDYIVEKYGTREAAEAETVYRNANGFLVDALTYDTLLTAERGSVHSMYDEELQLNEQKRRIKVLPAAVIPALHREFTKLFV